MPTIILSLITLIASIKAHSWPECTDYNANINTLTKVDDYDKSKCGGFIREWASYGSSAFGMDRGANYIIGNNPLCHKSIKPNNVFADSYTSTYPAARYTTGETVTVLWPAKNHANYGCFQNIPDSVMKIYYNPNVNPTSDPTSINDWTLVKDYHDGCTPGTDGCGFQNCIDFCSNTDKSICYGQFIVPSVSTTGWYTFIWYWGFNSAGNADVYTNCWEAYITVGGGGGNTPVNELTKNPTKNGDTKSPVKAYTPAPTLRGITITVVGVGAVSGGYSLTLEVKYWDIDCDVTHLYIKENGGSSYLTGVKQTGDTYANRAVFMFTKTGSQTWQTPLDLRITGDEYFGNDIEKITYPGLITNINIDAVFQLGVNFDCVGDLAAKINDGCVLRWFNFVFVLVFLMIVFY